MSIGLLVALLALTAQAAPPCVAGETQLGVRIQVEDPALASRIERHLDAALKPRSLSICTPGGEPGSAGTLEIELTQGEQVTARIEVRDTLTAKRIERSLDLSSLPADGRALALAAAADELLRASWAELLLRDAPPPKADPPLLSVATRALPTPSTRLELAAEAGAALASKRTAGLFGLRVGSWFRPRWAASVRLGGALGDRRDALHGSVRANELAIELAGSYAFRPIQARLGLALELGSALALVWFSAHANENGIASSFARGAWLLDGRVRAWWGPTYLRGVASAGVRWAARPVRALDEARTITGNEAIAAELTVGVASLF